MFKRGLTPAAALREAQLAMRSQKRWQAPYFWAAFVIQGQYNQHVNSAADPLPRSGWWLGDLGQAAFVIGGFFSYFGADDEDSLGTMANLGS